MRISEINRKTAETDIALSLNLDGAGKSEIDTGCGFLNHMLTLFAKHGRFDLSVKCNGDTDVDDHHTAEDIGICLGDAFAKALGDMRGIVRYGSMILPMDESLILSAVDISGRGKFAHDLKLPTERSAPLIRSLYLNFSKRSRVARTLPCISECLRAKIRTTSLRAHSKVLRDLCARQ